MRASVLIPCAVALVVASGATVILLARADHPELRPIPIATALSSASQPTGKTVRVAVIGGMFETGFWDALAQRYEHETGVHIELKAAGPKDGLDRAMRSAGSGGGQAEGIDLITMHASDAIINLVADGYATDPQPWLRNDMVLVGPPSDPAGVNGMTDIAAALQKIADSGSPFVVHSSIGAREVLRAILDRNNITFSDAQLTQLFSTDGQDVLKIAAAKKAYTLVGRIPFRTGKLPNGGLTLMVTGDDRLKRPYLVAIANPAKFPGIHLAEAQALAHWLRSPDTQHWIATFGIGKIDNQPLFFPVTLQ